MARRAPWVWSEIEHWTLPEVRDTMTLCTTQEEADDFTDAFDAVSEEGGAEHNLAYIISTISDDEERERLYGLFGDDLRREEVIPPIQLFSRSSLGIKDLTPDADPVDSED